MAFERFGKEHIALTKVIEKYFGADAGYLDISCLDLARVILEAGWTKQEWISVKDRLPEDWKERVLVKIKDANNIIGHPDMDTDRYMGEIWVRWGHNVTHWMPLPATPKGGN